MCEVDGQWEAAAQHREPSSVLRDDVEGRDRGMGGRLKKAGRYVCLWLIHIVDLEKEMATPCSILAWRIPWTEEPAGYSPRGHTELDTTELYLGFLFFIFF